MMERLHSQSSKMSVIYRLCFFILSFNTTFLTGNANADSTPPSKWQPYIDIEAKLGNERSLGSANLFLPLIQGSDRLFFADARFTIDDSSATEGNLGLAYRYRFGDLVRGGILGVYGFFDYRTSENNFNYKQLTGGLEWLANDWEVRANIYAPEDNQNAVSSSVTSDVALNGTTAIYRVSAQSFMEQALPGYDVEAGYRFGLNDRTNIWVHGGYFNFDDAGIPAVSGPRLRMEYRLQDPFGWAGSVLGLGLEGQDDDVRGSQGFVTARLRVPLGKVSKGSSILTGLDRRMINPIQRDVDVVTAVDDTPVEGIVSETPITDPDSGEVINVYFVEENGAGNCTQANPCVVGNAQGDAVYGAADIIVPLADSGDITSDILLTLPRQQVVGGGDAGNAILLLSSGDRMVISELGARPILGATLSMTDSSFAAGFNINHNSTAAGISANGITTAGVRDVNILGSGGAGFDFINTSGAITIENSSATNTTGAGLRISGGNATVALNDFDLNNTASGRSLDIQGTTSGSISFDSASSINNSGGSGLLIDNIGGDINFDGAVSVSGATSNAVTATNLNANTVAFNGALDITTTNGSGLIASNGTLNIAGSGTTINAVNDSALNLNNVSVGNGSGGALSFASLTSNGGANGLALSNVTATNGLTISNATLDNNTTAGININGVSGTLNIIAADVDAGAAATGLVIAGANDTLNIGTGDSGLDIDGGTTGVSINQSAGTVNLGSGAGGVFAVDGTSGTGVTIAGAGTVNIGTGGGSTSIGATTDTGSTAFAVTGGTVDATYAGSIALSSNTGLVSVQGGHSGTLIFSGALSNSAATNATQLNFNNADGSYNFDGTVNVNTSAGTGIGIDVAATSSGTIDFDNSLTFATASGNAIQMDGTSSLDISGGNLAINTTSGTAFSATGGGKVSVSGANNTIATTTGTALNITNTTIGASGLTFRSVSVNGAANGIVLNNTGTSGGLSVTGDGVTSGSGGTIQNTTGAGISLTNTRDVSLNYMTVTDTAMAGITGNGVSGSFTVQNSTIQNTVGHNIGLSNVSGVIDISNNTLLDANEDGGSDFLDENNGIDIANNSGTITSLTVTNNIIQGTSGTTSDVGVALHLDGTAVLTSATISQNTIQGHDFHAVRVSLDNDDTGDAPVVAGLDIINNAVLSSESTSIELNTRGSSDLNFTLSDNAQINSDFGSGVHVNAGLFAVGGNSTATVAGSILNNTITNVGDGANDLGIDILSQESSAVVMNIDGNNISDVTNGGIALRVRDTSSLDAVVNNNTLTNTDTFGGGVLGLFAETRETSSGCFAITNNTNALTYQLNQSAGTLFNLEPMVGNTGTVNLSGIITDVAAGTCARVP